MRKYGAGCWWIPMDGCTSGGAPFRFGSTCARFDVKIRLYDAVDFTESPSLAGFGLEGSDLFAAAEPRRGCFALPEYAGSGLTVDLKSAAIAHSASTAAPENGHRVYYSAHMACSFGSTSIAGVRCRNPAASSESVPGSLRYPGPREPRSRHDRLNRSLRMPNQELQDNIEHPALRRAQSGRFVA